MRNKLVPNFQEAEKAFEDFLTALGLDWRTDPNMVDTPKRVSKMYIEEIFSGLYTEPPRMTVFPNSEGYDQLIIDRFTFSSTCSHHNLPFMGKIIIGILPGDKLLGYSKYARVAEWFALRPQLQENLTQQIGKYLFELLEPRALGVYIKAQHMCACVRGVRQYNSDMITTAIYGDMHKPSLKAEFMESWRD